MNAGVYCRLSQDRTGEELGITRQREDGLDLAQRRGLVVHKVYVDVVSAAGRKRRPEFEAMLGDLRAGTITVVIAWALDRLARTARDRLDLIEACKVAGATIALVRGSDMDASTPAGRLVIGVLGEVAQAEIDSKSDRQRRAHRQAAEQGRRIGGRRPFGYEQDGTTIRKVEADAVKAAYLDYIAGTALSAIARRWNEAGMTSGVPRKDGSGERWEHIGVRHLLKNPRYMGMRRHQPRGKPAHLYPAAWKGLVDEATWRAANALLTSAERGPNGGRQLLTGVIVCAVCDQPLTGGGGKNGERMYRCPSGRHVTRRAAQVEEQVLRLVRARLAMRDVVEAIADQPDAGPDYATEAAEIRAEQETIARERAQRVITSQQFAIINRELGARLLDVERHLVEVGRVDALAGLLAAGDPVARFDGLDRDQQRGVIGSLMQVRLHSAGRGVRVPSPETVELVRKR